MERVSASPARWPATLIVRPCGVSYAIKKFLASEPGERQSEFCSDGHAETYKQQTLARLLDERGAPRALELPLPPDEALEEEQAPSSVAALTPPPAPPKRLLNPTSNRTPLTPPRQGLS